VSQTTKSRRRLPAESPRPRSIEEVLDAPWDLLTYIGAAQEEMRAQKLYEIEDAGAAEDRVRQDYTGRYPIELLQNAHDACADANRRGAVRFAVTDSALLVANQGVPFTAERVHSLVRLGSSDKRVTRGRRHTIGYKGVGFTAVFEISDRPQIISQTAKFEFDRRRAAREVQQQLGFKPRSVPARGYPFRLSEESWADDAELIQALLRDGAVTVIRLPLRANHGRDEVSQQLADTIPAASLLFMPSISELELILPDGAQRWRSRGGKRVGPGRIVHLSSASDRESWLLATTSVPVPRRVIEALDDRLWADVRHVQAGVAIPWDRGPNPAVGPQPIHVYFPTDDDLGRSILVHGDFYVDSSRRHIQQSGPGREIGERVASAAAKLAASLAESLADRGHPTLACFAKTHDASGFGVEMGQFLETELMRARIVRPADAGQPKLPGAMQRLGSGSGRFDQELVEIMPRRSDLVRPGDDEHPVGELLESLGVEELEWGQIAERIDLARAEVTDERAASTLVRLLDRVPFSERSTVADELRDRRVLRDASGRLRPPSELVTRRSDSPDLPVGLRRPELVLGRSRQIRALAKALKVEELTVEIALKIVLDAVRAGRFGRSNTQAKCVHDFIFETWVHSRSEMQAVGGRLERVRVPARRARGRRREWVQAREVYFPASWTGSSLLEALYGGFGRCEFLAVPRPSEHTSARSLAAFYALLGVKGKLRMTRYEAKRWLGSWGRSPWPDELKAWDQYAELEGVQKALRCDAAHEGSDRHVGLAVLDRLDALLKRSSREVGAALARYLSHSKSPYGAETAVQCTNSEHRGRAPRKHAVGYQRWRLTSTAWVPVHSDPKGAELRPPGQAWTGHIGKELLVPRAALRAEDAQGLGLVHAERPGIQPVEHALEELHELFPDLEDAAGDVHATADWLLTRLDRASRAATGQGGAVPPLPSYAEGRRVWSRSPLIQDLTGLDAFELEVLREGNWQGLRRHYGLRRASELVEQEVNPGPAIRALRVLSRDSQARLAALLAGQGGDSERVATRLARFRESPVSRLSVRFSVDGRRLGDSVAAPFFLSVQRDRRGAVRGATLFATPELDPATRITLARDLANYLDVDLQHSIALFLTNSKAVMESERISEDAIVEAGKRVDRHRRRGDDVPPDEDPSLTDLVGDDLDAMLAGIGGQDDGAGNDGGEAGEGPGREPGPGEGESADDESAEDFVEEPLPDLDFESIVATDVPVAEQSETNKDSGESGGGRQGGGGGGGSIDWGRLERERRRFGRRGEKVTFETEKRRVEAEGRDPAAVRWVSRENETAPYDILSVDDDGGPRYIEVKSTTGADPQEPFEMSEAELLFAIEHRERHFVYRVVTVKEPAPPVWRYRGPIPTIAGEPGAIRLSKARITLPEPTPHD
jgi:hypothetical protein